MISWASFAHPTAEDQQKDNNLRSVTKDSNPSPDPRGNGRGTEGTAVRDGAGRGEPISNEKDEVTTEEVWSSRYAGRRGASAGKWNTFLMRVAASRKPDAVFLLDSDEEDPNRGK